MRETLESSDNPNGEGGGGGKEDWSASWSTKPRGKAVLGVGLSPSHNPLARNKQCLSGLGNVATTTRNKQELVI